MNWPLKDLRKDAIIWPSKSDLEGPITELDFSWSVNTAFWSADQFILLISITKGLSFSACVWTLNGECSCGMIYFASIKIALVVD